MNGQLVELTNNGLMDMNGECMMYDWTSGVVEWTSGLTH